MAGSLRYKLAIAIVVSLAGCLCLLSGDTRAQDDLEARYFPETGHSVTPLFRAFYEDHGGLAVFGYPITESFFSPADRAWLQYFQNARLETQGLGEKVMVSPLPMNLLIERRSAAISPQQVGAGAAYFPATGHSVMLAFLDFYLYHGGPEVFGYPIAELVQDGDRLVQYFERAILEWYPELPNGQRVQLARLGELHFQLGMQDPALLRPEVAVEDSVVTTVKVSTAVQSSVMSQKGGDQVIYVYVTDQLGRPVVGARVDVAMVLPRTRLTSPVALTDQHGTAAFQVTVPPLDPGKTIPIHVHADYLEHEQDTASAFRIWW
jgi:hypothetical protein